MLIWKIEVSVILRRVMKYFVIGRNLRFGLEKLFEIILEIGMVMKKIN